MFAKPGRSYLALGLMSGTSRDGIDAALIETDGLDYVRPVAFLDTAYDQSVRDLIAVACDTAMQKTRKVPDQAIVACENRVTDLHIEHIKRLASSIDLDLSRVTVIGFHGHTVAHRGDLGWSWQVGDARRLADAFNVCVVSDLRQSDMDLGGQGAPLLPVYHKALFRNTDRNRAVLNLGGVANLTWLGRDGSICAFDCGMASALIDDYMAATFGQTFDEDGAVAATGRVSQTTLSAMMRHAYFSARYPKSLDRLDFTTAQVSTLAKEDAVATLTAFTAEAVAVGIDLLPDRVDDLIVTGGGRKNITMMRMIAARTGLAPRLTEEFGWNGDAIEAQGFAYMAVRRLCGLPTTFPSTTGAAKPVVCGVIT